MFIRKSAKGSTPLLHRIVVAKHGSHNQSSHGKKGGGGGGGGGGASSGNGGNPASVPENMSGDKKMDAAINALPKETRDSAYRSGFEMGSKARKMAMADPKSQTLDNLYSRSSRWVKDTKTAINQDNATMDNKWMEETVRAIGAINGILQS